MDQWNTKCNLKIESQNIVNGSLEKKKTQRQFNEERKVISTNGAGKISVFTVLKKEKEKNLYRDLKPFKKINLTYLTYLWLKCKVLKLLEENMGKNTNGFQFCPELLDAYQKHN